MEEFMKTLLSEDIRIKILREGLLLVVTGDKGGVAKTTDVILLAEWLNGLGFRVEIIDSDPNQGAKTCVDKCAEEGYQMSHPGAKIQIVDTAGTTGASLTKYILKADIILVPFQPHEMDLEVVIGWFFSISERLQKRVIFIPSRLTGTKEQEDGITQIETTIREAETGKIVPGLYNRPAIYPKVASARGQNFFFMERKGKEGVAFQKAFDEVTKAFTEIFTHWHKSEKNL